MKKLQYIAMMTAVMIFGSCTDLDEELRGDFNEDVITGGGGGGGDDPGGGGGADVDPAAAFQTLFNSGTANHGNYFSIQGVSSDEMAIPAKGGDWFDGGIWVDMHRHEWQTTSEPLNNTWNEQYVAIAETNRLLGEDAIQADDNAVAQLRVLRAYYYFRLMDAFGNVKLVTVAGEDAPQASRAEVYEFVVTEIEDAIASGDLVTTAANNARINEYAAWGLLAQVKLNAEVYTGTADYEGARDAADEVINSGLYELVDDYGDAFAPENSTNGADKELIWVVPYDENTGSNMNFAQMTLHYGSQATFNLTDQPWNGYTALEDFYNSYDDADERKENNFLEGDQFDVDGNPILDLATEGDLDQSGFQLSYSPEINELFPNALRDGGTRLFKFNFKENQTPNMDNDYPLVRYGDILLIKAEAEARIAGSWTVAETWVNLIRERAGVPTYSGTLTEDEFLAERGREMFMEATRRRDLIRFGNWGDEWWEKPAHTNADLNIWPIPLQQINAAAAGSNPLTQNPGYGGSGG